MELQPAAAAGRGGGRGAGRAGGRAAAAGRGRGRGDGLGALYADDPGVIAAIAAADAAAFAGLGNNNLEDPNEAAAAVAQEFLLNAANVAADMQPPFLPPPAGPLLPPAAPFPFAPPLAPIPVDQQIARLTQMIQAFEKKDAARDAQAAAEKQQLAEERAVEKAMMEASIANSNAASLELKFAAIIEAPKDLTPSPTATASAPHVDPWRSFVYELLHDEIAVAKRVELGLTEVTDDSVSICERALSLIQRRSRITGAMATALIASSTLVGDIGLALPFVHAYYEIAAAAARKEPSDKANLVPTNVRSCDAGTKATALAEVKTPPYQGPARHSNLGSSNKRSFPSHDNGFKPSNNSNYKPNFNQEMPKPGPNLGGFPEKRPRFGTTMSV